MKKIGQFLLLVLATPCLAQNNFKIGMFSSYHLYTTTDPAFGANTTTQVYFPAPFNHYYTSILGVLKEDGINLIQDYIPDGGISYPWFRNDAQLCLNHGMQLMDCYQSVYRPTIHGNIYNQTGPNCDPNIPFLNYDDLYTNVYSWFPSAFFGHALGAERAAWHYFPTSTTNCPPSGPPLSICPFQNNPVSPDWVEAQMLPQSSSDATAHFKALCSGVNAGQKIVTGEAVHGGFVCDYYMDPCINYAPMNGLYGPQHYINWSLTHNWNNQPIPTVTNPTNGDIFDDASYFTNQFRAWATSYLNCQNSNLNYLGKFASIDYARQNGYNEIFIETDITRDQGLQSIQIYNGQSNPSVGNYNLTRFYGYTSLIHKVHGIVFYNYPGLYDLSSNATSDNGLTDLQNHDIATSNYIANWDRFSRKYTPISYRKHLSKFIRELRYLVNNNYISDNDSQVLYEKTTQGDTHGILPPSTSYLSPGFLPVDSRDYNAVNNLPANNSVVNVDHTGEDHGLRYIIRTNGTEAIMIISNPNPFSLHNISLNFNNIANTQISNAKFVDVLFEDGSITDVNSMNYKTDTTTTVNPVTFNLNKVYSIPFCNKTITAEFGPFDIHIYHFRITETPLVSYQNGWQQVWSNNGNGIIGSWGTQIFADDKFIPFDFDGDGDDELLCAQNFNSNSWLSIFDYGFNSWSTTPYWTNNGSGLITGVSGTLWTIKAGDRFIPGDFNGDGIKNELLCVAAGNTNAKASILKRNGSNQFYVYWTNNGNGFFNTSSTGWGLRTADKFQVGDFNFDGKMNELLCVQGDGTWAAVLSFNSSTMNFDWNWGNGSGVLTSSSVWSIGAADEFYVEDYNGDGTFNDVLCVNRITGKSSVIYNTPRNFTWVQRWTNGGNNIIGSWGGPIGGTDALMVGNIDGADAKAELMFIQRSGGNWAMTEDFNSSNQPVANWGMGWQSGPAGNFLDTWRVNSTNSTRYMFIHPVLTDKKYLLAFRDQGCNNSLISMYKVSSSTANYRQSIPSQEAAAAQSTEKLHLYPNPTTRIFTVSVDNMTNVTIEIFDITGKLLYTKIMDSPSEEIDPGNLAHGVYLAKASSNDKVLYKRFIIQ